MLNLPSLVITQWLNTVNKLCASLHLNYVNCSTDWVQYPVRWKIYLLDSLGKNCDLKKYTYRFLIYGFVLICIKVSSYHVHQPFETYLQVWLKCSLVGVGKHRVVTRKLCQERIIIKKCFWKSSNGNELIDWQLIYKSKLINFLEMSSCSTYLMED